MALPMTGGRAADCAIVWRLSLDHSKLLVMPSLQSASLYIRFFLPSYSRLNSPEDCATRAPTPSALTLSTASRLDVNIESQVFPTLPYHWQEFIAKCLDVDPKERWLCDDMSAYLRDNRDALCSELARYIYVHGGAYQIPCAIGY